ASRVGHHGWRNDPDQQDGDGGDDTGPEAKRSTGRTVYAIHVGLLPAAGRGAVSEWCRGYRRRSPASCLTREALTIGTSEEEWRVETLWRKEMPPGRSVRMVSETFALAVSRCTRQ